MNIVCLGWGSLIWNPRDLKVSKWQEDGPALPVEFARVSQDGRLTLVLLNEGHHVPFLHARMEANDLPAAVNALAQREGCSASRIGTWKRTDAAPGGLRQQAISAWARERNLDGVVWTALGPRFAGMDGRIPTSNEAVAYLRALAGEVKPKAEEYVRKTPRQIRTPYRQVLENELGWTELAS
jgi:hypothetical protein